jgi:hypothetical protein
MATEMQLAARLKYTPGYGERVADIGRCLAIEFRDAKLKERIFTAHWQKFELETGYTVFPEAGYAGWPAEAGTTTNKPPASECIPRLTGGSADPERVIQRRPGRRVKPPHDHASPFPQTFNAKEVAAAIGRSPAFVYSEAKAGHIHYSRYNGRLEFSEQDIQDYIRAHRVA